jgi:uncharacterized protein YoxC
MNSLTTYFYILMLASASGLCISLIFYFNRIVKSVKNIEGELVKISDNVNKVLDKTAEVTNRVESITGEVQEQLIVTKSLISKVDKRVDEIFALEAELRGHFAVPIKGTVRRLSAAYTGFSTFWNEYKKH